MMLRFFMAFLGSSCCLHAISLKEAIKKAYEGSVELEAKIKEIEALHEKTVQATAEWRPKAEASFGVRNNFTVDSGSQRTSQRSLERDIARDGGVQISQNIFNGGQTTAKIQAVKYQILSKRFEFSSKEQEMMREVIRIYCEMLAKLAEIRSHKANVTAYETAVQNAVHRLDAGAETSTQVSVAQQKLAEAKSSLERTYSELDVLKAQFVRLVGVSADNVNDEGLIQMTLPEDQLKILKEAEKENPKIISAHYAYLAAQKDIDASTDNYMPQVDLEAGVNRRESRGQYGWDKSQQLSPQDRLGYSTERSLGVRVKWNLYNGGATASVRREKGDIAVSKRIEKEGVKIKVIEDLTSALSQYSAYKKLIVLCQTQENAAIVALRNTTAEVVAGSKVLKDALDAQTELQKARLAKIEAKKNMHIAFYRIFEHMGRLTSENLKLDLPPYAKTLRTHYMSVKNRIF